MKHSLSVPRTTPYYHSKAGNGPGANASASLPSNITKLCH